MFPVLRLSQRDDRFFPKTWPASAAPPTPSLDIEIMPHGVRPGEGLGWHAKHRGNVRIHRSFSQPIFYAALSRGDRALLGRKKKFGQFSVGTEGPLLTPR